MKASEFDEKNVSHADKKWNVKGESKVQLSFERRRNPNDIRREGQERKSPKKEAKGHCKNKIASAA